MAHRQSLPSKFPLRGLLEANWYDGLRTAFKHYWKLLQPLFDIQLLFEASDIR